MRHALLSLVAAAALVAPASAQLVPKTVDVAGVTRSYLVYLPAGYDGVTELPVVLVYHGGDMTSQAMLQMVDLRPMADAEGFVAVYPQGLVGKDGTTIWDSVGPWSGGVDEIGFTSAMIDALDAAYAVDLQRVYACGYSNGANLVWELACFLSDRVAAVGAVAGSMWQWTETLCAPTRPVPVLSVHGTQDWYNPWSGGPPFSLGLLAASAYWAANAGADLSPAVQALPDLVPGDGSTVERYTFGNGSACVRVEHYKVLGGGHDWPGVFGNMDIDASQVIWDFVSQFDLGGQIGCSTCAVTQVGVGAGGANLGTLDTASSPVLGSVLQLDLGGFATIPAGVLVLGAQGASLPALGGTLWVDPATTLLVLPTCTSAAGACSMSLPVPSDPSFAGLTAHAQAGVLDATQAQGWALSNGLVVSLCL